MTILTDEGKPLHYGKYLCCVYDAYYTLDQEWVENKCSDPECDVCADRPATHNSCKCKIWTI